LPHRRKEIVDRQHEGCTECGTCARPCEISPVCAVSPASPARRMVSASMALKAGISKGIVECAGLREADAPATKVLDRSRVDSRSYLTGAFPFAE
jgi:hypothetical protein